MPIPQLAIAAALLGGSALQGFLQGRSREQSTTTTTKRDITPQQQAAIDAFLAEQNKTLASPYAGLDAERLAGLGAINQGYASSVELVDEELGRRGIRPGSGAGSAIYGQAGIERGRSIGGLEQYIQQVAASRKASAADRLFEYGNMNFGQTSTTKGKSPSNMFGSAVDNVGETAGYLVGRKYFG